MAERDVLQRVRSLEKHMDLEYDTKRGPNHKDKRARRTELRERAKNGTMSREEIMEALSEVL